MEEAESVVVETIICGPLQYKCNSGECIANSYKCNGIIDCRSRDDEFDCGKRGFFHYLNFPRNYFLFFYRKSALQRHHTIL